MTGFIREGLLILIPFLIAVGKIAKTKGMETKYIPFLLLGSGIAISIAYGFITSTLSGWRYFVDSIVFTGILQGAVVSFAAMGLYDTGKSTAGLKKAE